MALTISLPSEREQLLGNIDEYLQDQNRRRDSQKIRGWDVFNLLPQEERDETETSKLLEYSRKALKVASYIFSFVIVLCTAIVAKGALLLMTSLAQPRKELSACPIHHRYTKGDKNNREYKLVLGVEETAGWAWCLFFVIILPNVFVLLRSIRICVFKSFARPKTKTFIIELVASSCHSIGLALLVFCIFPLLDVIQAIMLTSCVCLAPGIIQLLSRRCKEENVSLKVVIDVLALSAQLSGFLICIVQGFKSNANHHHQWIIPVALFLLSFAWWENYVSGKSQNKWLQHLLEVKYDLSDSRYFLYMFLSVWKVILTLAVMLIWYKVQFEDNFDKIFTKFVEQFSDLPNILTRTKYLNHTSFVTIPGFSHMNQVIISNGMMPVYVAVSQVIACWLCYVTAKFACRTCIQAFGFALPLHLASPLLLALMVTVCDVSWNNVCVFKWFSPYVFWTCPQGNAATYDIENYGFLWMLWLMWLFSQVWFTIHTWTPKSERLASTEKLFVNPMYCSVILDQSLLLNRRREDDRANEEIDHVKAEFPKIHSTFYKNMPDSVSALSVHETYYSPDCITRIYACATMWHETKEEMIQLLKSLFRMDEDQSARRIAQKFIKVIDKDYYEFQAHIFFDDAFEASDFDDEDGMVVNEFVKLLIGAMDTAASNVHNCLIKMKPPKKIPTPYGGRLVWKMPGGNELVIHLKDKQKIRHKKRWSQVMYMYYLLGRGIMESEPKEAERKAVRAENTYILALDGDINFRPLAVQLLVDLMKKNKVLGAACGRIHPVGSGPMVWYQKFEYAIGHWLQKATEHMIGCVLCSPGCFSLFRAKALMDDNVMRKYTTMSEEARDYVQYDQGEDRWLCTLLLQRGYRVEYCAASDAYTHCPEGFGEFYNQRRRWAPSTMANIMDLLSEYKSTVAVNDSISMPYIVYQLMLMIGSILGPGTIFLMLVGAMVAAFRIPNIEAFVANFVPIVLYIIICFFAKNDFQILVAQILSAAYALLMMAVLVGTAIQLVEDGIGSPAAIFLIAMTASFVISAIFHPQEFFCLLPGVLYFLSVPSMYLFLILYSLINLNNVSWGTREVLGKPTKAEMGETQIVDTKKKKNNIMPSWLENLGIGANDADEDGGISCNLSNLCRCMLCTYPKDSEQKYQMMKLNDQLGNVGERLYSLETKIEEPRTSAFRRRSSLGRKILSSLPEEEETEDSEDEVFDSLNTPILDKEEPSYERTKRDDMIDPLWMDAKQLRKAETKYLDNDEIEFWRELIATYLFPLEDNKEKQRKVSAELKDLRNKVVSAFLMCNALFVLVVFLLQLNKDQLHIEWPIGAKYIITFVMNNNEVVVTKIPLRVDPIGIVFVSFFALILVIQFLGMLFHRLGTMTHILASEEFHCCDGKMDDISDDAYVEKNAIKIVREMQQLNGINGDDDVIKENGGKRNNPGRRPTIQVLNYRQKENKAKITTLDTAFAKRFFSISSEGIQDTPILSNLKGRNARRGTLKVLEERRESFMAGRESRGDILGIISEADGSAEMERLNAAFPTANGRTILTKQISESSEED